MKTPEFLKKTVVNKRSPYIPSRMTKPNDGFVYEISGMYKASYIRVDSTLIYTDKYLRLEDSLIVRVNSDTNVRVIGKIKTIEIELDE